MNTEELDQLEYLIIGNILNKPELLKSQAVRADYFEDYGCYQLMDRIDKLWQDKSPIVLSDIAEEFGFDLSILIDLQLHVADQKIFRQRVEKLRQAWIMRGKIREHIAGAVGALEQGTRPEYVGKALITNLMTILG